MLDAKLLRFARWMQGVRKQQESGNKIRFGGAEYCGLASTVGVATEKDPARHNLTQNFNRVAQARAIAFRLARERRGRGPLLAKREIASQEKLAQCSETFAGRGPPGGR